MSSKHVKTPVVLQMEAVECGAAALGIILGYFGKHVALEELRYECGVSRDGSKASNMVKAARKYGLEAKGMRRSLDSVFKLQTPFIAFWGFNHFLVVEGKRKNRVYLNDPATGRRSISLKEFDEQFTGVVLYFEPSPSFEKGGKQPGLVRTILSYGKPVRKAIPFVFLVGFLSLLISLITPVFAKVFVDNVLVQNLDGWLTPLLLGMAFTLFLLAILSWTQQFVLNKIRIQLMTRIGYAFMWRTIRLPIHFYNQRDKAEIGGRFNLVSEIADLIAGPFLELQLAMVQLFFFVVIMFIYQPVLAGLVLLVSVFNVALIRQFARKNVDLNYKYRKEKNQLLGTSMNGILMIETLKAGGRESDFFENWAGHEAKVLNAEQEIGFRESILASASMLFSSLTSALVLIIGGFSVLNGDLTIGALVAFFAFTQLFNINLQKIVNLTGMVQYLQGSIHSIQDLEASEIEKGWVNEDTYAETKGKLKGHIQLNDITFGYSRLEEPLIKDLNVDIKPGSRVAFVGGSGSGKSTVAKLITGIMDPWSGDVKFDEKGIYDIPRHVFKESVSMVDQDVFVFEGKVKDVLTFWDEGIEESVVIQACKDAGIHDEIAGRANGYESLISENGSNYSGGQRQRLEIARALVNSPSILVMDEATSALDTIREKQVYDSITARGITTVIIAHRLSAIRDCDEIFVFKKGEIVQRGTHTDLIQQDGEYKRLIQEKG